jgi:peroxiredoxin
MRHLLLFVASLGLFGARPPAVGERPPSFNLKNLDGEPRQLSDYVGKGPVVLLVLRGFPGYQCPLCNRQVTEFVKHSPDFAKAGARVVMVYPGPAGKAGEFVADKKLPAHFELLVDPAYAFTNQYNLRWDAPNETAYPSTFVIDKNGLITFVKISNSHGGRSSASEVLAALTR